MICIIEIWNLFDINQFYHVDDKEAQTFRNVLFLTYLDAGLLA